MNKKIMIAMRIIFAAVMVIGLTGLVATTVSADPPPDMHCPDGGTKFESESGSQTINGVTVTWGNSQVTVTGGSVSFCVKAATQNSGIITINDGQTWTINWLNDGGQIPAISYIVIYETTPSIPVCGNGILEPPEACDDGNLVNGDGCSATCTIEPPPVPVCGNGILEPPEACDDGNLVNGDGCSSTCTIEPPIPVCGNGTLEPGEGCDDGNLVNGDGCSSTCAVEAPPVCGNGILEVGEACDDGNLVNGDGCSSTCTIEPPPIPKCGNGILEPGERCDDGNLVNGDGCSATCMVEAPPPSGITNGSGTLPIWIALIAFGLAGFAGTFTKTKRPK
jgi:cysteine-rich repeat protein